MSVAPFLSHPPGCFLVSRPDLPPCTLHHPDSVAPAEPLACRLLIRGVRSPEPNMARSAGSRVAVLCALKPLLDRDTLGSQELRWTEEVVATLQRSLLESQWALASASRVEEDGESAETPTESQDEMGIVRSGRPSARQRRLSARMRSNVSDNRQAQTLMAESTGAESMVAPVRQKRRRRRQKNRIEPLQDFVSSFLRPALKCDVLSKDVELSLARQMRIRQSLEKSKRKLSKQLGHEPPYELWAHSLQVSTGELLSKVAEGEIARKKMMTANLRLVVSVARHYQYLGVDMADLIQEGSKGLLRGLERFDHRKGYKLSTYVHWWIRQGVTRAIADHSRMMRVPVYMHDTLFAIRKGKARLYSEGKPITVQNLSELLDIPSKRVERALQVKNKIRSLDRVSSSYGLTKEWNGMHEIISDEKLDYQPWTLLDEDQRKGSIMNWMATLTPKEKLIIRWHYGFDTEDSGRSSLEALGQKLGISKERVRQIECAAMQKMQLQFEDSGLFTA